MAGTIPTAPRSLRLRCIATSCGRCGDLMTHARDRVPTYDDPPPQAWCADCKSTDTKGRDRDRSRTTYKRPIEQSRRHGREQYARRQAETVEQAPNRGYEWTTRELEIVLDRTRTSRDVATQLGRTYSAVVAQRFRDGKDLPPQIRSESSAVANEVWRQARQSRTRPVAKKHFYQWTGPELEVLMRDDGLSLEEKAFMLGRTYFAAGAMRRKCLIDPRKMKLAGMPR